MVIERRDRWPEVVEELEGRGDLAVVARAYSPDVGVTEMDGLRRRMPAALLVGLHFDGDHNAYWLIRSVRDRFPRVRVVAIGSNDEEADVERALLAGVDGYLDIGWRPSRFLEGLNRIVAGETLVLPRTEEPEPEEIPSQLESVQPERRAAEPEQEEVPPETKPEQAPPEWGPPTYERPRPEVLEELIWGHRRPPKRK